MLDYYKILGIPRSADHQTIKSAYKRLALKYHPDRNPSNKAAEEYFKVVNEAHQTLIDPEKKAQYDLLLNYAYEYEYTSNTTTVPPQKPRTYRPPQERSYYERYGKFNWRNGPRYKTAPPYKIDKSYFKIQLFTLFAVVAITLFCVAIFKVNQYLETQRAEELRLKNEKILAQAHQLYNAGQYRMALNIVIDLANKNPIENRFSNEKEVMVAGLNSKAIALYKNAEYDKAVEKLEIVRDYESPMRLQTWRMIADCNYQLKNYKKAIHALEYILMREKNNIDLIIRIGDIYYDDLGMIDKALDYYTEAKYMFKEFQSASYGKAFELIMPVERVPKLYFDMFTKRGEINMAAHNYAEAVTDYNWAIFLRPAEARPYHLRAVCQEKTGNISRACNDWQRAASLGYQESNKWMQKYCR